MIMRFKPGDKVKLVRPSKHPRVLEDTLDGRWNIPPRDFINGRVMTIKMFGGNGKWYITNVWSVFDDMLDPLVPLTPFEQMVHDYISAEQANV